MAEVPRRETGQIIPFPVRNRAGKPSYRGTRQVADRLPANTAMSDCGSGWYHDAAVQDEIQDEAGKRPPH